jgi:ribosome-associated heat shock protein Hsp15
LSGRGAASAGSERRLDQWLWFARLTKSRSLAAQLCAAGAVLVNGSVARKASQTVRTGDTIVVPQGPWRRAVRILALGMRRGPAAEARSFYEEIGRLVAVAEPAARWTPLLADDAMIDARDETAG